MEKQERPKKEVQEQITGVEKEQGQKNKPAELVLVMTTNMSASGKLMKQGYRIVAVCGGHIPTNLQDPKRHYYRIPNNVLAGLSTLLFTEDEYNKKGEVVNKKGDFIFTEGEVNAIIPVDKIVPTHFVETGLKEDLTNPPVLPVAISRRGRGTDEDTNDNDTE